MTLHRDLLEVICCPNDQGDLVLKAEKEDAKEILAGTLTCAVCHHAYPIEDGIPNLLPPEVLED